jgi:hypothetical protein
MRHLPVIDYDSHPGFAGLNASGADAVADGMIADIETAFRRVADQTGSADKRLAAFDQDVAPKIDELLQHLVEQRKPGPDFSRFAANAFANARQSLKEHLRTRDQEQLAHNSAAASIASSLVGPLADFRRDGFFATHNTALARKIWSRTMLERAQLRAKRCAQPTRHCAMPLALNSPGRDAVASAMEAMGIRELAAAYLGKPVEFYYAALEHSHDGQNWYRDCYADTGLGTSKTVYMHFDADCNIIKGLFYLNDVEAKDGPFRFLPGSHRWERPHFATAVQRGFDAASAKEFPVCEDGLDYVSGYYRPRFQSPEQRRAMMSLPASLRGSTHFGDDLLDGSPLSNALLEKEHSFIGPAGTLVLFDGSRGIHRGSQAGANGNRWVVQVAFRVVQPRQKRSGLRTLAGKVKGRMLYLYSAMRSIPGLIGRK